MGAGLGKGSQALRKARDGAVIQSRPAAPAPTALRAKPGAIPEFAAYPRSGK